MNKRLIIASCSNEAIGKFQEKYSYVIKSVKALNYFAMYKHNDVCNWIVEYF